MPHLSVSLERLCLPHIIVQFLVELVALDSELILSAISFRFQPLGALLNLLTSGERAG